MPVCEGKNAYLSEKFAVAFAAKLGKDIGKKLYPYQCPICDAWHLSSMAQRLPNSRAHAPEHSAFAVCARIGGVMRTVKVDKRTGAIEPQRERGE